jgi:hypothetical protein
MEHRKMASANQLVEKTTGTSNQEFSQHEIRYTRAIDPYEFEGAFRCLYQSYRRRGLAPAGPQGMRLTRYHLLPFTRVFIARIGRQVVGTLSLVEDSPLGVPMRSVFSDYIDEFARDNPRVAEATCLAIRDAPLAGLEIVHHLMGLAAQSAKRHGIRRLLVAVHPRHATFYEREAGFRRFAPTLSYPNVGGWPAVPLQLDLATIHRENPSVYRRYSEMKFSPVALSAGPTSPLYLRRIAALWQATHTEGMAPNGRMAFCSDEEEAA